MVTDRERWDVRALACREAHPGDLGLAAWLAAEYTGLTLDQIARLYGEPAHRVRLAVAGMLDNPLAMRRAEKARDDTPRILHPDQEGPAR